MVTDLIGRHLPIDALHVAVDAARDGSGGIVLLAGDAGMGKTALASETAAYARSRGALTVWGTCWDGDGAPGYWPWIQVIRALGGNAVLAEITATTTRQGRLSDDASARFRTYDAVVTYVREQAAARPLVVILDDLHWADISSLRLLAFLAHQLHDVAVLVVATCRNDEVATDAHPAGPLLAELARRADVLQLTGLVPSEVGELLHKVCGTEPSPALTQAVHARTAGNPFFVQEIGRLLAAQGSHLDRPFATGVPPVVSDVLARRLARLPTDAVDLLATAAAVGRMFTVADLATIAAVTTTEAMQAVELAVHAGIVEYSGPGQARFIHDLFREVVYDTMDVARRSAIHLALAEMLERDSERRGTIVAAAEIAHHRVAAFPAGDRDLAVAALLAAAREATAHRAFDEAAGHLGRAVDITGGAGVSDPAMLCELGDTLRRAGRAAEAKDALMAAATRAKAAADSALLARAAFGLHRVATITDSSRADVIAMIEAALAVDESRGAEMRWLLMAALARELADGPDRDLARATSLAEAAVAGARINGDDAALAYALFALADVRWEPGTAAERLQIAGELAAAAARAGEIELLLEAQLSKVVALLERGEPAFASELDAFARRAEETAIPRWIYLARSRRATLATLTGPLATADDLIDATAAYGARIGEPDAWGVQASQLVGLALLRHDWTRLHMLAESQGKPLTPPEFALGERGWLLIESGDREAAAALVGSMPDRSPRYRWRYAALLTMDAELAAAVGDRDRCRALYDQLLPMADQFAVVAAAVFTTGPVSLQLGLLAAALERWDDAANHLADAVARSNRLGADLLADRAREELARVRARSGALGGTANSFRRNGDTWMVAFAGRSVQLRDAKGLRDLAFLLASPGGEVAAVDLVAGGRDAARPRALGADPLIDEKARAAYRTRLHELDDDLAEADAHNDIERMAQLTVERDALVAELVRATGLGGRRRRLGDEAERARTTVTARIRESIRRIERVHPELGAHLQASVITGSRCSYRPAETVRWDTSQS